MNQLIVGDLKDSPRFALTLAALPGEAASSLPSNGTSGAPLGPQWRTRSGIPIEAP
jgi:hypothetical protein